MDVLQNQQLLIQTQSWDTFTTTSMSIFTTTKVTQDVGARLGRLTMPSRTALDTPHYVALTSRGVVPHLTPDNTLSETHINGVYVALEDCKTPVGSIHSFADSSNESNNIVLMDHLQS